MEMLLILLIGGILFLCFCEIMVYFQKPIDAPTKIQPQFNVEIKGMIKDLSRISKRLDEMTKMGKGFYASLPEGLRECKELDDMFLSNETLFDACSDIEAATDSLKKVLN